MFVVVFDYIFDCIQFNCIKIFGMIFSVLGNRWFLWLDMGIFGEFFCEPAVGNSGQKSGKSAKITPDPRQIILLKTIIYIKINEKGKLHKKGKLFLVVSTKGSFHW